MEAAVANATGFLDAGNHTRLTLLYWACNPSFAPQTIVRRY